MPRSRRVLLVYALPHSGHSSAAAALEEELVRQGMIVEQYNFQEQWNVLGKKANDLQKWIIEHTPWFWKHVHGNEDYAGVTKFVVSSLTRWDITGLFAKIEAFKPDAIIATHMLPLRMLAEARLSGHLSIPVFAVTTDLWVHRYWAHNGVDGYFASTKVAKQNLIDCGVNPARIEVTGIPIRSVFLKKKRLSRERVREQLKLVPDLPHITIAGGSSGIFPFKEVLMALLANKKALHSVQWTCIFGTDQKSLKKAERLLQASPTTLIRMLGFTQNIDQYFLASDLVITKAGGLTTSEVVACQVPLMVCAPIPGQEEGNANLLCEAGAAVREDEPARVIKRALALLAQQANRQKLEKAAAKIVPGKSTLKIAQSLQRLFKENI